MPTINLWFEQLVLCRSVVVKVGLDLARIRRDTDGSDVGDPTTRSADIVYRKVKFPFAVKGNLDKHPDWCCKRFEINVDGYAERLRRTMLQTYYLCVRPATRRFQPSDVRLFYVDRDGDQIEIVSDVELVDTIREHSAFARGHRRLVMTARLPNVAEMVAQLRL
jgi:PB1 domain